MTGNIQELDYVAPEQVISSWPESDPLVCFGGQGSTCTIIALKLSPVPFNTFLGLNLLPTEKNPGFPVPFTGGYLGLVAYDEFSGQGAKRDASQVFFCERALVFLPQQGKLYLTEQSQPAGQNLKPAILDKDLQAVYKMLASAKTKKILDHKPVILEPRHSDVAYLQQMRLAKEMIRGGRFQQITLLRYFNIVSALNFTTLKQRFTQYAGPMGCIFHFQDFSLFSFSPELFVSFAPEADQTLRLRSYPLKGAVQRDLTDASLDLERAELLKVSSRHKAKLTAVVDGLRGELSKLGCQNVLCEPFSLGTFSHLHHLMGEVSATLKRSSTFKRFFSNLCPAGSITGAPKADVLAAIYEFEQRERGYFMGNAFYYDPTQQSFSSSVLIRTVFASLARGTEYAAGSGIILASEEEKELLEIKAKCLALTAA